MKQIFTLFISLSMGLVSMAADGFNRLTVAAEISRPFSAEIDGRLYQSDGQALVFTNLSNGYHQVKVYADNNSANGRNTVRRLIYDQSVSLRGLAVEITLSRSGNVMVQEETPARPGDFMPDYRDARARAMTEAAFDRFYQSVRLKMFASNRMSYVKTEIPQSFFTSAQVKELLELFPYENDKLEVAKLAYDQTIDQENYDIVIREFKSANSQRALRLYIRPVVTYQPGRR